MFVEIMILLCYKFIIKYNCYTITGFLYFLSFTLILFTTLVGIFKKEDKTDSDDGSVKINVIQNYKLLLDILKLPCVRELAIILITMQVICIIYLMAKIM